MKKQFIGLLVTIFIAFSSTPCLADDDTGSGGTNYGGSPFGSTKPYLNGYVPSTIRLLDKDNTKYYVMMES
ncbi:hypothetical protein [Heliomicrobium gestii]|uniref:hypothetical protein n=1 Tax=Heliomicrobium gestii TaxID=2699 RepID=UPI001371F9EC|nr:hypothetical protein [Heliomicrobium gestii]MBM7867316.1 hypothetical protein [Heliomicrobium gestii]